MAASKGQVSEARLTVERIVARLGGRFSGDGTIEIRDVATLEDAQSGHLSFLANPKYRPALQSTSASAVIVDERTEVPGSLTVIRTDNPYLYFARAVALLHPAPEFSASIHSSALVSGDVHRDAYVGPGAVVDIGAVVEAGAVIGPNCVVGRGARVGAHSRLVANVVVYDGCRLGQRCLVHAGVVIGADGFGFARTNDHAWEKFPQVGSVSIGDDVEIGANTTIDRGALSDTIIGNGVKIDNQIQIGHNVEIGDHTAIAGCVGIAGSTKIGKRCMIGGQAGIIGHLTIGDDVVISAGTLVTKSITKAGVYTANLPLQSHADWVRNFSRLRHLDAMAHSLKELEKRLDKGEHES